MNPRNLVRSWIHEFSIRWNGHGISSALSWFGWHFGWEVPRKIIGIEGSNGEHVFDKEWDVLILLDAMRVDLLDEVVRSSSKDYDWLGERSTITSVSGKSSGWMRKTFSTAPPDILSETAYITGNPHTKYLFENTSVERTDFGHIEELWRSAWDDNLGTVPPRPITDRGIATCREKSPDRLILHYMQPHFPSIPDPIGSQIRLDDKSWNWSAWEQLKRGETTYDEVWSSYRSNLKYVLKDLELLLDNLDAETVVISSDHGNAIGERGYFGHNNWPVKSIKEVPWCVTTAHDYESYEPTTESPINKNKICEEDVEARLKALGYR